MQEVSSRAVVHFGAASTGGTTAVAAVLTLATAVEGPQREEYVGRPDLMI